MNSVYLFVSILFTGIQVFPQLPSVVSESIQRIDSFQSKLVTLRTIDI